jgi:CheY-like chemotaxis protein
MPDTTKPVPLVYVVDDEDVISQTLAAILNVSGFRAIAFTDPLQALCAAEGVAPDLLISDVMMPGMNGIELDIRFRTSHPSCKLLFFSGQAGTANLLNVARDKGHDFQILAKPVHPKDLLAAIAKL